MSVSKTFNKSHAGKVLALAVEHFGGNQEDFEAIIDLAMSKGVIRPSRSKAAKHQAQIATLGAKFPGVSRKTLMRWIAEDKKYAAVQAEKKAAVEAEQKKVEEDSQVEPECHEAEKAAAEKAAEAKQKPRPRSPSPERSSSPDTWWSRQCHHNEQAGWNEYYRELNKP